MNVSKKAALVAAATGALVLSGAQYASAFGIGSPFGGGYGGAQINDCFTNASIGGDLSPSGAGNSISANCINVGKGNGFQANHCQATDSIDVSALDLFSGPNEIHTNCANVAIPTHEGYGHGGY